MKYESIRKMFGQTPFRPLIVRMLSGVEYVVTTPESIVTPRDTAFIAKDGGVELVATEFIEAIRPRPSNGSRRKRPSARR